MTERKAPILGDEDDPAMLEVLGQAVLHSDGCIASDAISWSDANGALLDQNVWPVPEGASAHPGSTGCYSRFISRWVCEGRKLSLLEAVRKTSLIPAQILEPAHLSLGFRHTIVHGIPIIEDGNRHGDARPGRAIHRKRKQPVVPRRTTVNEPDQRI